MILFLALMLKATEAKSPKVIYGEDNRKDVYAETNALYKRLALSTAALMDKGQLTQKNSQVIINGRHLGDAYQLCSTERFYHQISAAHCSGTLIAPDIILTAGHCYDTGKEECKNSAWVFDFKVNSEKQSSVTVSQDQVYNCKEILSYANNPFNSADHALIRLDRVVTNRTPLKISTRVLKLRDELVLIGHPLGLPTKIASDGHITKLSPTSFETNLDAFTINSGSGVMDAKTGEVVGVLSSGAMDLQVQGDCLIAKTLKMEEGQEQVMKLEAVRKILEGL